MKNNPKLLLYISAAILAFLLWQKWQIANLPPAPAQTANVPATTGEPYTATPNDSPQIPTNDSGLSPSKATDAPLTATNDDGIIKVKTDVLELDITRKGGFVVRAQLPQYLESKNGQNGLTLLHTDNPGRFLLQSVVRADNINTEKSLFEADASSYELGNDKDSLTVPLTWQENGISVTKTYIFKRGAYNFALNQKIQNNSEAPLRADSYISWIYGQPLPSGGIGQVGTYTGGVASYDKDPYEKIKLGETFEVSTVKGWMALSQHYFVGAIVPAQPENDITTDSKTLFTRNYNGDHYYGIVEPKREIAVGNNTSFDSTIYLGPKIQKDLKAVAPNLDKTVDYGFLFMIGQPMYYVLHFIHSIVGNWGWALILMTLLIKVLFFTPSAWAYKSMAKMRRLGPEMQRIKEQYGDDRQAASMAMMKLYKDEKVNPASGCLPMLLQIPFFIAFYWVLIESVELRHAPWLGWIHDLSAMDPYFILPIINAALMFLQQKLNPPPPDPTQAKVMMMLPLVFGFMFMWFPSGLVLYWTVSNAFGIVQQYIMNKRYGDRKHPPHDAHGKKHNKVPNKK